jgi:hypothetical protein
MRLRFLIFIPLFCVEVNAQNSFQYVYHYYPWCFGFNAKQTPDLGYIILGSADNPGDNNYNIFLQKTDSLGIIIWTKTFSSGSGGQGNYDYDLQVTSDHGYVITTNWEVSDHEMYVIKLDSVGNTQWAETFNVQSPIKYSQGNTIKQTQDGGYIVSGWAFSMTTSSYDVVLLKLDASGSLNWSTIYGLPGFDKANCVMQTSDGNYIVAGTSISLGLNDTSIYLLKTDSIGMLIWSKSYGGNSEDVPWQIIETSDSGYAIVGRTKSFGAGAIDIYCVRTDKNGDTLWTKTYGGFQDDYGTYIEKSGAGFTIFGYDGAANGIYKIVIDSLGDTLSTKTIQMNVGLSGTVCHSTIDGGHIAVGAGSNAINFFKLDSIDNSVCNILSHSQTAVTTPHTIVDSLISLNSTGLQLTNSLVGFTGVGPDTLIIDLCITTHIEGSRKIENEISIYPNPTLSFFKISNPGGFEVTLSNTIGEKIWSRTINSNDETINCENLPPGIYFVQVQTETGFITQKLIKQ